MSEDQDNFDFDDDDAFDEAELFAGIDLGGVFPDGIEDPESPHHRPGRVSFTQAKPDAPSRGEPREARTPPPHAPHPIAAQGAPQSVASAAGVIQPPAAAGHAGRAPIATCLQGMARRMGSAGMDAAFARIDEVADRITFTVLDGDCERLAQMGPIACGFSGPDLLAFIESRWPEGQFLQVKFSDQSNAPIFDTTMPIGSLVSPAPLQAKARNYFSEVPEAAPAPLAAAPAGVTPDDVQRLIRDALDNDPDRKVGREFSKMAMEAAMENMRRTMNGGVEASSGGDMSIAKAKKVIEQAQQQLGVVGDDDDDDDYYDDDEEEGGMDIAGFVELANTVKGIMNLNSQAALPPLAAQGQELLNRQQLDAIGAPPSDEEDAA